MSSWQSEKQINDDINSWGDKAIYLSSSHSNIQIVTKTAWIKGILSFFQRYLAIPYFFTFPRYKSRGWFMRYLPLQSAC